MNKGIYFASFTALLWGFLAIGLKVAVATVSPITVTWFRFLLAFSVLIAYYLLTDAKSLKLLFRPPLLAVIAGFALGCNYIGYLSGVNLTTPIVAQIFVQLGPVFLAISGFVLFKERFTIRRGIGLLTVFLGLFIFYKDKIAAIAGDEIENYRIGLLWLLFAAITWTLYAILQKKEVEKFDPMQLNLIIFGVPTLFLAPMVEYPVFETLSVGTWGLLTYLGLNTLIAYGSLSYAFKYLEANKVSVIVAVNPLITFGAMAILTMQQVTWIAPERYTIYTLIGAIVALTGVVLTVLKTKNPKAAK